jgi:hypothetical protein
MPCVVLIFWSNWLTGFPAMIFNAQPWYNEPGREQHLDKAQSEAYNGQIQQHTLKHAILYWLTERLGQPNKAGASRALAARPTVVSGGANIAAAKKAPTLLNHSSIWQAPSPIPSTKPTSPSAQLDLKPIKGSPKTKGSKLAVSSSESSEGPDTNGMGGSTKLEPESAYLANAFFKALANDEWSNSGSVAAQAPWTDVSSGLMPGVWGHTPGEIPPGMSDHGNSFPPIAHTAQFGHGHSFQMIELNQFHAHNQMGNYVRDSKPIGNTTVDSNDDYVWGEVIRKHFSLKAAMIVATAKKWDKSKGSKQVKELEDLVKSQGFLG